MRHFFPRRHRRGLIEAIKVSHDPLIHVAFRGVTAAASLKRSGQRTTARCGRPFRGVTAAASLKLADRRFGLQPEPLFPRRHRRGLIEADHRTTTPTPAQSPFRGVTAAASLKPLDRA